MEVKKPWQSKALWFGLISAVAPFIPAADAWIKGNEMLYTNLVIGAFMLLRLVTKGSVSIE